MSFVSLTLILLLQSLSAADQCAEFRAIAKQSYRELQTTYSDSAEALVLRGEARFQTHQYPEALRFYQQAVALKPDLRGVHSALASVYLEIKDSVHATEENNAEKSLGSPDCEREPLVCKFASEHFQEIIESVKSSEGPEALYWRARASRELADSFCNRTGSTPVSVAVHQKNAEDLERNGRFRDAAKEWRAAMNLAPENAQLRHALANALFNEQDFAAVLPELQQLREQDPGSANLNFFVGDALLETEEPQKAIPFLTSALKTNPHLLPAHVALGLTYMRLGKPGLAIPHLSAGLPLDNKGSLYYQLARAYTATHHPKLAQQMMEKYREKAGAAANSPAP